MQKDFQIPIIINEKMEVCEGQYRLEAYRSRYAYNLYYKRRFEYLRHKKDEPSDESGLWKSI